MSILNTILGIPTALAQVVNAGEIANETEGQLTQLVAYIIGQIPLWITAFIIVVITFIAARMAKSAVENKMATEGFEEENKEVAVLASRSANTIVLVIGITVALKIAGIDLTAIIAAGAFGVGFALQDIIMNFIAGVMILSSGHYHIGDVIKVGSTTGKIQEIQTRATIIKAFDGTKIVVPNASLFKNEVTNFTANPFRRIELASGVNYGEDLEKTIKVVMDAVKSTNKVLAEPKPRIAFYEWGPYSINFKVKAWVESRSGWIAIRNNMLLNIDKALHEAGINIPYPIQTIEISDEEKVEQLMTEPSAPQRTSPPVRPSALAPQRTPKQSEGPKAQRVIQRKGHSEDLQRGAAKSIGSVSTEHIDAPTWLKKASKGSKPAAVPQAQQPTAAPQAQQPVAPVPAPLPTVQPQPATTPPAGEASKTIPGITPAAQVSPQPVVVPPVAQNIAPEPEAPEQPQQ